MKMLIRTKSPLPRRQRLGLQAQPKKQPATPQPEFHVRPRLGLGSGNISRDDHALAPRRQPDDKVIRDAGFASFSASQPARKEHCPSDEVRRLHQKNVQRHGSTMSRRLVQTGAIATNSVRSATGRLRRCVAMESRLWRPDGDPRDEEVEVAVPHSSRPQGAPSPRRPGGGIEASHPTLQGARKHRFARNLPTVGSASSTMATVRCLSTMPFNAHRIPRRESFALARRVRGVLPPLVAGAGAAVAAHDHLQRVGLKPLVGAPTAKATVSRGAPRSHSAAITAPVRRPGRRSLQKG